MDVPAADRRLVRAYPRLIGAVACAVLATLLLLAEVVLFVVSPRRSATAAVPYRQGASLTYGATVAPSHVYPDGSVSTGQPVYPDQVPDLPVQVGYVLSSAAPASVHGQIGLTADVTIGGVPGAHLVLAAPQSFTGSSAHVGGTLPVGTIVEQADAVGGQGGAPASGVQVQIRPTVTVEGTLGATPVKTSFGPAIVLTRNSGAFVPLTVSAPGAPPVTAAQQLAPAAQGALARPVTVPRHVDLLVAHPTVGGLRVASAVLFLLLGGGAA